MGVLTSNGKALIGAGKVLLGFAGAASAPIGAGTLAIADEPQNQRVFQRVGTSKLIALSGTLSGQVTQVQARAVPVGTALTSTATAWTDVPTDAAAGTYASTLLIPQGGWYEWQVRDKTYTNIAAKGANKWGVGIVLGVIGQSNPYQFATTSEWYPAADPRAVEYSESKGKFTRLGTVPIPDTYAPNTTLSAPGQPHYPNYVSPVEGQQADALVFLANTIVAATGLPVCIVQRAVSGSGIDSWIDTSTGSNFDRFKNLVLAAGGDMEVSILWQAEANASMPGATWKTKCGTLHGLCKGIGGRDDSNYRFGVISLGPIDTTSTAWGGATASTPNDFATGDKRRAQVEYANGTPGAFLATAAHDAETSDDVHVKIAHYRRMAGRIGLSVAAALGFGRSGAGPRITSASRSGTTVTATVTHAGGTLLKDGAGGTGAALRGFEYLDSGGSPVAITGTAITGAATIQFTLASAVAGTLSYAMHNCPHNTDPSKAGSALDMASIVYDELPHVLGTVNSAEGCVLQPLPPLAVA